MNRKKSVDDKSFKLITHVNKTFDGKKDFIKIAHSAKLDITEEITVEAWVNSKNLNAEVLQSIVSKWSPLNSFNTFDAYDAGSTSELDTTGFLGAVFDGRYIYFSPQHDTKRRHGKALRYDTHGDFYDPKSWMGYNAEKTSGLNTKGFYGAVFDGIYVYFVPRRDEKTYHTRILRYDTRSSFAANSSWQAYDAGLGISYQSAGFDGRYIYFAPGTHNEKGRSGLVLRYDTQASFDEKSSWVTFDAGNTGGLETKDFDGVAFDGRYIYFVPLSYSAVLRYDTTKKFKDKTSWSAFDAKPLNMKRCVGSVFDGRYIYFVTYDHNTMVRYDTNSNFEEDSSWSTYDVKKTSGLTKYGYDGGFFDGRYVYFVPFIGSDNNGMYFHCEVLRYDTKENFEDSNSWKVFDASDTSGLKTIGYNAGAFDGRYFYCAPWHDGESYLKKSKKDAASLSSSGIYGHGRVLRYDTLSNNGSFSLRYCDYGHNGGLCAAVPGPRFIVNTDKGVRSIAANKKLEQGEHYIVGVYNGRKIQLFVDGMLVNEQDATGKIIKSKVDITIGRILDGLGYFNGHISEIRISDCPRSADWIKAEYNKK